MTEFSRGELVVFVSSNIIALFQVDHVSDSTVYAEFGSVISCNRSKDTLSADNWEHSNTSIFPRKKVRKVSEEWMRVLYESFATV